MAGFVNSAPTFRSAWVLSSWLPMPTYHVVKQGECLSTIADQYGFVDYKTIYCHPENANFRRARTNPNVIHPFDRLYIPDLQLNVFDRPGDETHKFIRKRQKTLIRIVVKNDKGDPCEGAKYQLLLGFGDPISGTTAADGLIEHEIPIDLDSATLEVKMLDANGPIAQRWTLALGHLDPVEEPSGVQARLNNLGFDCGEVDGVIGPKTEAALREFQKWANLDVDGKAGPQTWAKLQSIHGC